MAVRDGYALDVRDTSFIQEFDRIIGNLSPSEQDRLYGVAMLAFREGHDAGRAETDITGVIGYLVRKRREIAFEGWED